MLSAIIDLGTNTFHLLIFKEKEVVFKESLAAKMGMGGINQGFITPEGIERSIKVLNHFKAKLEEFSVPSSKVFAFGTSALRSALNQKEVLDAIFEATNLNVSVIDGKEEATLIYEGVKSAVDMNGVSLIVDIGGGSVEFIICNTEKVLWLQSFEIGGQRLMEKFMKKDPIPNVEINKMEQYFREILLPLSNAIHQYQPEFLIGSSGTFDTLNDIFYQFKENAFPPANQAGFEYPIEEFIRIYEKLVFSNREERMQIPGMIELRVDMIVVATILIKFLIFTFDLKQIKISNYALKEGAMKRVSHA